MTEIRLVLVVRDEIIRTGIQTLIEGEDHAITLMTYTDLESLQNDLEHTLLAPFDLLIIDDSTLTPVQIFEWVAYFEVKFPHMKIILLSERLCSLYIHKTLSMGVVAYIHKQEIGLCLNVFLKTIQNDDLKVLSPILSPMIAEILHNLDNEPCRGLNQGDLELLELLAQVYVVKAFRAQEVLS